MQTLYVRALYAVALSGATAAAILMSPTASAEVAPEARIAAVKKSFADSQALLRQYEWIETTVTSLKGEEKSRVTKRCYYGADGVLQKVPVAATAEKTPGGIRGKIAENKKEQMTEYMQQAAALLQQYLPPDPARLQACKDGGRVSILMLESGKRAALVFGDYLQPRDSLSIEIDLTNNSILGARVNTALGKDKDPITLNLRFNKFADGTIYTAQSTLDAAAKQVTVNVQNSGFRRMSQ